MKDDIRRQLNAVWGTSGDDVYAVGSGGVMLHYNGTDWSEVEPNSWIDFQSIYGNSRGNIYAVGDSVSHYNGSEWTEIGGEIPSELGYRMTDVWVSGSNDVYMVGEEYIQSTIAVEYTCQDEI